MTDEERWIAFASAAESTRTYSEAQSVAKRADALEAEFTKRFGRDLPPTPGACHGCEEQGFIIVDGGADIERCDNCMAFDSDDAALAAAVESAVELLKDPRPRAGVRFDKLLEALAVAAAVIRGSHNTEPTEE